MSYPWSGEFEVGNGKSPVAVITLSKKRILDRDRVAIHGRMQTENIGIEKVVANTISNPRIRFLILFGDDVKGHRSGASLKALHQNGIDENNRISKAPGAVPFIENLSVDAINRFRQQVTLVDMMGITDIGLLAQKIEQCWNDDPGPFGEPMLVVEEKKERMIVPTGEINLHHRIKLSIYGDVSMMEG